MTGRSGWYVARVYFCLFLFTHNRPHHLLACQHCRTLVATPMESHRAAAETSVRRHHCCMSAASTMEGPCAVRDGSNGSMSAHQRQRQRRVVVPQQRRNDGSIVTRQRPQQRIVVAPQQAVVMAASPHSSLGRATGRCSPGNTVVCSIQSSAKVEVDDVANGEAHEREAGGALAETILPVPGTEHPVEAGVGTLLVSAHQLLPSIRGTSWS